MHHDFLPVILLFFYISTCTYLPLGSSKMLKTSFGSYFGVLYYALHRLGLFEEVKRLQVLKGICCERAMHCLHFVVNSSQHFYFLWIFVGVGCHPGRM